MNKRFQEHQIDELITFGEKDLLEMYRTLYSKVYGKMLILFDNLKDGKGTVDFLGQWYSMKPIREALRNEMVRLNYQDELINDFLKHENNMYHAMNDTIVNAYTTSYKNSGMGPNQSALNHVINTSWTKDGKMWSDRIWNNTDKLVKSMSDTLFQSVYAGMKKDDFIAGLKRDFDVSFYQADRLIRTELAYAYNQGARDRYTDMGFTHYEFVAESNENTCSICQELNGKIFKLSDAVVGENFPVLHPNCRCTVIPVVNEEGGQYV